jgi:hypothetical protein
MDPTVDFVPFLEGTKPSTTRLQGPCSAFMRADFFIRYRFDNPVAPAMGCQGKKAVATSVVGRL